jgi:putative ATPase
MIKTESNITILFQAFIKSMRGSDPNGAVYWLARMIAGGEDVKFIARRMLILLLEDIGLANPNALTIANNCFQAVNVIGNLNLELFSVKLRFIWLVRPSLILLIKLLIRLCGGETNNNLPVPLHLKMHQPSS